MRGPIPKPAALEQAQGNPGKRPLKDFVKIKVQIPKPPLHLCEYGVEEWERISKDLFEAGLITEIDGTALAAYCDCFATWRRASEDMKKTGYKMLIKDPRGFPVQNPLIKISGDAMKQMQRYLVEFGMTPSSRTRVKPVAEENEDDPFDKFQKERLEKRGELKQINRPKKTT